MNRSKLILFFLFIFSVNITCVENNMQYRVFSKRFDLLNVLSNQMTLESDNPEEEIEVLKNEIDKSKKLTLALCESIQKKTKKYNLEVFFVRRKITHLLEEQKQAHEANSEMDFIINLRNERILLLYYQFNLQEILEKS